MSTAIMHSGPFYDFGDLILKNQPSSRNTSNGLTLLSTQPQQHSQTQLSHAQHIRLQQLQCDITVQTTQQAAVQQQQQQQQQQQHQQQQQQQQQQQVAQQQKILLHSALTRAVSHPVGGQQAVQLLNSINEILGHKKLERTQSEPLPQLNTSRYKTELCRPFEEAGECKYGDKCQFAHGIQELRNLQRHPKYKTELCRTFHSVGFCPYGPRCHFVHNAEEARNHNRNVAAYHARLSAAQAAAAAAAAANAQNVITATAAIQNTLPLSPPLSMSTGSDRASPTGSLSLSPTNSMVNFFPEHQSPTSAANVTFNGHQTTVATPGNAAATFAFPNSPPASPVATTPPPSLCEEARLPVFNRLRIGWELQ